MAPGDRARCDRGQGTVEWIALVLLASLAAVALGVALGSSLPGGELARAIASRVLCAVRLSGSCERGSHALVAEYGPEVAALVREHAPTIHYGDGAQYLPVDHRRCRRAGCAVASGAGAAWRTGRGLPATAFTRVVDCRSSAPRPAAPASCAGRREGNLYFQYWLYYPDSRTEPWGERGYHRDDWESLQVRVGTEIEARASSHHSYNYTGGVRNWPSDAGVLKKSAWGPYTGELHVTAGSHAGRVREAGRGQRHTPSSRLRLVPIEPIADAGGGEFAVTPPWRKEVYLDPEAKGT